MNIGGIVVCGGQSQRMGRPKAWLPFAGELMLPRILRLLGEAVGPLVVVAAPGQDLPPLPEHVAVVRSLMMPGAAETFEEVVAFVEAILRSD